jgi:hypothetical protein
MNAGDFAAIPGAGDGVGAGEVPSAATAIAAATPASSSIRPSSARSADLARIAVGAIAP